VNDEERRLRIENSHLRESLEYMYYQHRCGCGHPSCKRCKDDKDLELTLGVKNDHTKAG